MPKKSNKKNSVKSQEKKEIKTVDIIEEKTDKKKKVK